VQDSVRDCARTEGVRQAHPRKFYQASPCAPPA